jgi:hypothetical protein
MAATANAYTRRYVKTPIWKIEIKPISKFLIEAGIIDCDPLSQRPDVESLEKMQGIINSVLLGYDICEIALRTMDKTKSNVSYEYRSIDGGHRKRAILKFFNNRFKTGPNTVVWIEGEDEPLDQSDMLYTELDPRVQAKFLKYDLRFVIYGREMTDAQAGQTFRLRNETTPVNHQEMLNSYEDNLVAELVRETARVIQTKNNTPHQLFTIIRNSKDEVVPLFWQKGKYNRLIFDTFVARTLLMIIKNDGATTTSDSELNDMYINLGDPITGEWVGNPEKKAAAQKALKKALDFILTMAETRKRMLGGAGLIWREAVMLSRLYFYFDKQYGPTWVVKDNALFFEHFKLTIDSFIAKHPTQLEIVYGNRTKAEAMSKHLAVFNHKGKIENTVQWFVQALGVPFETIGLVVKDKIRGLSKDERVTMWLKQDKKCYVTETPLPFEDSVAAHIEPHELGGKTDASNIVIVHKKINAQMGSQNLEMYKKAYQATLNQ